MQGFDGSPFLPFSHGNAEHKNTQTFSIWIGSKYPPGNPDGMVRGIPPGISLALLIGPCIVCLQDFLMRSWRHWVAYYGLLVYVHIYSYIFTFYTHLFDCFDMNWPGHGWGPPPAPLLINYQCHIKTIQKLCIKTHKEYANTYIHI